MSRRYWFGYNGVDGQEGNITYYSLLTTNPSLCGLGRHLCAIYIYADLSSSPVAPDFSFWTTNMQAYITNAKANGQPQPTSIQKFVYMKS